MERKAIIEKLSGKGLRVTPQRVTILETILSLENHPTADHIINYIKSHHPNISIGTVYKVLDSFVENNIINRVKTEGGSMRFEPAKSHHHHLYCEESDRIEDYRDEELDFIIKDYFTKKKIKNFNIENIQLHISGTFKN